MEKLTFVLVPGAGGSAWFWHRVAPILQEHGHATVQVTLPAANNQGGLPENADVTVRAIGDRDPKRLVVVGHSLGGFTLPLVCLRVQPAMLVLVNAMIPDPGETPGEWWGNTGQKEARRAKCIRDGRDPDAPFDLLFDFFHDVPKRLIDDALAQGAPSESDAVFESPCDFGEWPAIPTRILVGRDDRFFPAEFQARIARERLGTTADEMPGGHLLALSQPGKLSKQLLEYAAGLATV